MACSIRERLLLTRLDGILQSTLGMLWRALQSGEPASGCTDIFDPIEIGFIEI